MPDAGRLADEVLENVQRAADDHAETERLRDQIAQDISAAKTMTPSGVRRSQDDIVARIHSLNGENDFWGYRSDVLLVALDFEHAQPFLRPETTEQEWTELLPADIEAAAMECYDFALGKIRDHRGLSADRSVYTLSEYAWLLGRDDVVAAMENAGYASYGAPKAKAFGDGLGLAWPDSADMVRMAAGEPCSPDCYEGCV